MRHLSFLAICFLLIQLIHCKSSDVQQQPPHADVSIDSLWQLYELHTSKQRVESAKEVLDTIISAARQKNDAPDELKAIYLTYVQISSKEGGTEGIKYLKGELAKSGQRARPLLHYVTALSYYDYYRQNQWEINSRTAFVSTDEEIESWGQEQFVKTIHDHLFASVDTSLQTEPINEWKTVLEEIDSNLAVYRPVLYDVIIPEVTEILSQGELQLLYLDEQKWLKDPAFFADREGFYGIQIKDTLSLLDDAISLYQNWLKWREGNDDKGPLAHADLSRLKYFYAHSNHPDKDDLYLQALERFMDTYEDTMAVANAMYERAQIYHQKGPEQINPSINAWQKSVQIAKKLQSRFPGNPYAKAASALMQQITAPDLSIQMEEANLPGQPSLVNLRVRNLNKVELTSYKIDREDLEKLRKTGYKEFPALLEEFRSTASQDYALPVYNDFRSRSFEVSFDALNTGLYILVAKAKESLHWQSFEVTDLASYSLGGKQLMVVDRRSGDAIAGADVTLEKRNWKRTDKETQVLQTDSEGRILMKDDLEGNFIVRKIEKGERVHYPDLNLYSHDRDTDINNRNSVHILTDRSIYRPGQLIYFKGILYNKRSRTDWMVVNDQKVTLELIDQNGQVIGREEVVTNQMGSFDSHFRLPDEMLTGSLSIQTPYGSRQIRVEEYKRPTFTAELEISKGKTYVIGDSITIEGLAETLNGIPLDRATVDYTVRREYYIPWYSSYWPPINEREQEIASGSMTTGDDGKFAVKFLASADTAKDHAKYKVMVEVTDQGGETQTATKNLSLSRKAFQVRADIPEIIRKSELSGLAFKAVNNFGEVLEKDVRAELLKVDGPEAGKIERYWSFPDSILLGEEEFRKHFTFYAFKDKTDPKEWQVQQEIAQHSLSLKDTTQLPSTFWEGAESGWFQLAFYDEEGDKVNQYYFEVLSDKGALTAAKPQLYLLKEVFSMEAGEVMDISFVQPFAESPVYQAIYYPESPPQLDWNANSKLTLKPSEQDHGGIAISLVSVANNRIYTTNDWVNVPWTNKELSIKAKTFREVLKPGVKEEWTFTVSDPDAELAAVLYDASLDEIYEHDWSRINYPQYRPYINISYNGFHATTFRTVVGFEGTRQYFDLPEYPRFIFSPQNRYRAYHEGGQEDVAYMRDGVQMQEAKVMNESNVQPAPPPPSEVQEEKDVQAPDSDIRENLNETVFFYPNVSRKDNDYEISFTMGEALTAWNLFLFAHTKDVRTGTKELQVQTRKELMIRPHLPRFFRSGDSIQVVGRIQNQSEDELSVNARLVLKHAITGETINAHFALKENSESVQLQAGRSTTVAWKLVIPEAREFPAVRVEMYAESGQWSDGEANILPLVTDRIILREALPLEVAAGSEENFDLEEWSSDFLQSETAVPLEYGLEFTKQPLWYAVQALPYLSGSEYECSEQLVNRLFANGLASKIATEIPSLPSILKQWEKEGQLESPLMQDDKWKAVDIDQTPWLRNALEETKSMQNIELLLDKQKREYEAKQIIQKLHQWQNADGGFSWFRGGPSNYYMTQYIAVQLMRIQNMELAGATDVNNVLVKAINYCDNEFEKWYAELSTDEQNFKTSTYWGINQTHYFYLKSLQGEIPDTKAWKFVDSLFRKEWTKSELYDQGLLSRSWQLQGETAMSTELTRSIKERAIKNTKIGAYWNQQGLRRTYTDDIELHALMIELFEAANDRDFSNELKTWLIKNKQTNRWSNTKSTAAAIHALLLQGKSGLAGEGQVRITADDKDIPWTSVSAVNEWHQSYEQEAGKDEAFPFEHVNVVNERTHPAWGAAFVQYSEKIDAVGGTEGNGLTIEKKYFLEKWSIAGSKLIPLENVQDLKTGDVLVARIIVSADRSMDFVHLKSERPANMEPVNQLSGFRYRDGIGYFESIKDLATHFFVDHLPKGTFVFEHRERVALEGDCLGGISQIESMYAPEFRAHTTGKRIHTIEQ